MDLDEVTKIVGGAGLDWGNCLKCGGNGSFQTSSTALRIPQPVHAKACKKCGFVELYCPEIINGN